jgi:hypothetical protein
MMPEDQIVSQRNFRKNSNGNYVIGDEKTFDQIAKEGLIGPDGSLFKMIDIRNSLDFDIRSSINLENQSQSPMKF